VLLGDQAEVEDDDAARGGDEDIGGLEVAVLHAAAVEGDDAGGELAEGGAQAGEVGDGSVAGGAGLSP
jgi:hypothetical protein